MKKICFVVPYFGELPRFFGLWLQSCGRNSDIDFLIVTDNKVQYELPDNVQVLYWSFAEMKKRIQSKIDFQISLNTPYKLCDYRPVYGEVFSEYLVGYDFWGHCDIDLIFGNIRGFISDELLDRYDRLLTRGHFSLYRNVDKINSFYKTKVEGCQYYRDVYSSDDSFCFDEWAGHSGNGISYMFNEMKVAQYDEILFADLDYRKYQFVLFHRESKTTKQIFTFKNGVFAHSIHNKDVEFKEYLYIHFQKRDPIVPDGCILDDVIFVPPNDFRPYDYSKLSVSEIKNLTGYMRLLYVPVMMLRRLKRKLSRNYV